MHVAAVQIPPAGPCIVRKPRGAHHLPAAFLCHTSQERAAQQQRRAAEVTKLRTEREVQLEEQVGQQ